MISDTSRKGEIALMKVLLRAAEKGILVLYKTLVVTILSLTKIISCTKYKLSMLIAKFLLDHIE